MSVIIGLEGMDGSGKSSLANMLASDMADQDFEVRLISPVTIESMAPDLSRLYKYIMEIPMSPMADRYALAAYEEGLDELVMSISADVIVLDRVFRLSDLVYLMAEVGPGSRDMLRYHTLRLSTRGILEPDLTVVLDGDFNECVARIAKFQKYERKGHNFLKQVHSLYRRADLLEDVYAIGVNASVMDATGTLGENFETFSGMVEGYVKGYRGGAR